MTRMFILSLTLAIASLAGLRGLSQQPDVIIRPRIEQETRLAVADFVARATANDATETALKVFNEVLWNDLKFCAFFNLLSKNFYPLKTLRSPQDVDFENWRSSQLDADFLIFGNLQADAAAVVVEAYLYDVKTGQQVLGKRYRIEDSRLMRRVAHEFSDQVVYQLSAGTSKGVARTSIAYTSARGGSKEIFVTDYDGWNARSITANGGLNKFPDWARDNSRLAFVTSLQGSGRWELWIQNLKGGKNVVKVPSSFVSSPSFSPDGNKIAYSTRAESANDPDLFISDPDGGDRRNITRHPGIDTSPSWSPTGQQIAFISDRSGTPQVWVVDADGSNLQRLVNEGGHCDSPNWSRDGRFVAYSWQAPTQWKHDIYLVDVSTGKIFQLTSGNSSNEHPHWSPDGRHIVFQSDRSGSKQIFIMNADGNNLRQVTAQGSNEGPAWSGYAGE
ncbi:MAG: PD40 domain-containing protein [Acidobacteria bacterium]|nr:PD40 domain-containing protein [Acidobacteriota bacterium]